MKKIIGFITSWTLYYLGHFTSKLMNELPFLYSTYNWLMIKSMNIQDWAKLKSPWKNVKK